VQIHDDLPSHPELDLQRAVVAALHPLGPVAARLGQDRLALGVGQQQPRAEHRITRRPRELEVAEEVVCSTGPTWRILRPARSDKEQGRPGRARGQMTRRTRREPSPMPL